MYADVHKTTAVAARDLAPSTHVNYHNSVESGLPSTPGFVT